jgi:integrase
MAKIRKRGNSYQIDYFDPNGKRVRQSFRKRKDAEAELGKRVSLIAENPKRYLEIAQACVTTFDELAKKYKENFKGQRSFENSKSYSIKKLEQEFKGRLLSSISYYDLEAYRNRLRSTLTQHGQLRKEASVNRVMACLRHMLSKGVEWGMLERNPFDKGRSLQLKENNKRLRFLSEEEIAKLLSECPKPDGPKTLRNEKGRIQGSQAPHLKNFIIISINTGMRKGEVLSLTWPQIRNGFIYLEKTKTDEARQIPINGDLEECFKGIRKRQQLTSKYVFSDGKEGYVEDIKTAFRSALKRAGITDFRPHDLRHTFASHYIMRGGSLKALKEILGHADIKMTMRYAHLSKEFAKEEIQIMNGLTSTKKKATGNPTAPDSENLNVTFTSHL